MKTMTFQARELKDALAQVREQLGPDALIVKTRQVTPLLGLGRPVLEVTAALPDTGGAPVGRAPVVAVPPKKALAAYARRRAAGGFREDTAWFREGEDASRRPSAGAEDEGERAAEAAADAAINARLVPLQREVRTLRAQLHQVAHRGPSGSLQREVEDLRAVVQTLSQGNEAKGGLSADAARLMHLGIDRELATKLVQRARALGDTGTGKDLGPGMRKALAERIVAAGPVGVSARVAAFIGPTGVGKTTTVAKIAARAALMDGARVALITIDTFRIGAIEQLQHYADLMELPLHIAGSSAALRAAVRSNQSADLILIDTAGRGPRDVAQLAALREVLGSTDPVEVHLCLSATTRGREQALAIQSYRPLQPSRLCLTKLDEAISLGEALNLHEASRLPISYFGVGQRVPEDLELCTPEGFVDRLLSPEPQAAGTSDRPRAQKEGLLA